MHPGVGHPHVWHGISQTSVAVQSAVVALTKLESPTGMKLFVDSGPHVIGSSGHATAMVGHSLLMRSLPMQMSGQAWPCFDVVVGMVAGHLVGVGDVVVELGLVTGGRGEAVWVTVVV
jgi:hypothetical protein